MGRGGRFARYLDYLQSYGRCLFMTSTPYMIAATGLTKRFGLRTVVDQVSFIAEKGEVLGFLGPNAAGKTTTMKMLTCFFPPTAGTVMVNGFDVVEQSIEVRRSIGFLPENVPLYTEMTVREYLEFAAAAKGIPHVDRRQAVMRTLDKCNLGSVENQIIGTISRGYRQRVGLGQAIINEPPVLILDEPTVGLDPAQIKDIRELIVEIGKTSTVILSTHILPEVSLTCNRVLILNHGKIMAEDTPENLVHRMQHSNTVRVSVEAPVANVQSVLGELKGVSAVKPVGANAGSVCQLSVDVAEGIDLRRDIARVIVEKGWGLLELANEQMSLEDVFLNVVREDDTVEENSVDSATGAADGASAGDDAGVADDAGDGAGAGDGASVTKTEAVEE